jgi:dUTPase
MSRLFIIPTNDEFADLYRKSADTYNRTAPEERNAGFDLFCDGAHVRPFGYAHLVEQGCRALAVNIRTGLPAAYWLAPRSSISKSGWRLANSIGLIDATYRGVLMAALDPLDPAAVFTEDKQRLVQLTQASLEPWFDVIVVAEMPTLMPPTARGEGGFGSTGI